MSAASRSFTLLESLLTVVLLSLAAGILSLAARGSADAAAFREARSILLDADARARAFARAGVPVDLVLDESGAIVSIVRNGETIARREMRAGVIIRFESGGAAAPSIRVDSRGRSRDYQVRVARGDLDQRWTMSGVTGWAFGPAPISGREPSP